MCPHTIIICGLFNKEDPGVHRDKYMAEKAKKVVKTKTVNRTGKKLVQKALVMGAKKTKSVNSLDQIKKLNEEVSKKKLETRSEKVENTETRSEKSEVGAEKIEKKYSLTIGPRELLAAGCHLGHKIAKTNPRAKENIYAARDGIQIFDLMRTKDALEEACNFVYHTIKSGKKIVMLGTKRQSREVVKRVATENNIAYVTDRWLGGTITNWEQIRKNIKKLIDLKEGLEKGSFKDRSKKEQLEMAKEVIRLEKIVGGLVTLSNDLFDVMIVVDAGLEKTAISEAKLRKVKTVALCDSDTDPNRVDYAIPTNDDNVKSISLIVEEIGRAIKAAASATVKK